MQGRKHSKGMSKSETGSQKRVWNGEGQAGSSTWSSKNRTKVCGWMGYVVGDLRRSLGHGEVWIGVPVRCYTECNTYVLCSLNCLVLDFCEGDAADKATIIDYSKTGANKR